MSRYVIRRLLQAIPTFLGITLLTFAIVYSAPGDPVLQQTWNPRISSETREEMRHRLGLDQPLPVQYLTWLLGNDWMNDPTVEPRRGILRGDFGISFNEKRPVMDMIGDRLWATLLLTGTATLIGYAVGIPVGVVAAARPGGIFDNVSRILAVIFNSVPGFWLSLVVILLFAVKFREWNLPAIPSIKALSVTVLQVLAEILSAYPADYNISSLSDPVPVSPELSDTLYQFDPDAGG